MLFVGTLCVFIAVVYAMSFTLVITTAEVKNTIRVFIGDIDNDGDLDWIAGNRDNTDTFVMDSYFNGGSMIFGASMFGTSLDVKSMKAADIDGDGDLDFVISKSTGVYKFVNDGDGNFIQYTVFTSGFASSGIAVADFNNDGSPDIVVVNSSLVTSSIYINDGHGNFTATPSTLPSGVDASVGDFNSDGYLDLVIDRTTTNNDVYLNSGTGAFIKSYSLLAYGRNSVGDVDNDGDLDIVVAASSGPIPMTNNGQGTFFGLGVQFGSVSQTNDVALADIDNNGSLDAIIAASDVAGGNGGNELWLGNGGSNFLQSGTPTEQADYTHQVAIGDLDGDGDLDYVAGNDDQAGSTTGGANRVYTSDQAATSANTAPTAPTAVSMTSTLSSLNAYITTIDSTGNVGTHSSIAVTSDDLPVIAYYDDTNDNLKVIKCGNTSCSSGNTTTTIDSTGDVGKGTSIGIGGDGFPVISYWDTTNGSMKVAHCGNAACSSGNTLTTVDASVGGALFSSSLAIGTDGFPVIAYYSTANGIEFIKCGNAVCSTGNILGIGFTGADTPAQSVTIGADGNPVVVYFSSPDLLLVKCGNASCTSGNSVTDIGSNLGATYRTSVAIGADNFPVVAYSLNDGFFQMIKCGNASCSTITSNTEIGDDQGFDVPAAIKVGTDGLPVVTYVASTAAGFEAVRVIKCGNAACSSGNTSTLIDRRAFHIGESTSLGLLSDDTPVLVYSMTSVNDLSYIKCGNTACSSGGSNGLPNIRITWGSGSDTQTLTKLLQYQPKVGTGAGAHNIVSGVTASPNWVTRLLPNGQSRSMILRNLTCGKTYYWNVATVDNGFKQTWGTEQQFTLDADCSHSSGGGPPPPPPPPPPTGSVGGGLPASYFRTNRTVDSGSSQGNGVLSVTAFYDLDSNGRQSNGERGGFKGLPLTASGRTADNAVIRRTLTVNESGKITFDLPASDARGYWIIVDTGSSVLSGYIATGTTSSGGYILRSGSKPSVAFGFRRTHLLSYRPCLLVGSASKEERSGTDAQIFMQRLEDSFGSKIFRGLNLADELVSRKEFFTLLSRSHCIEQVRDHSVLLKKLKEAEQTLKINLPLIDLRIDVQNADSLLAYSLLASEADISRSTLIGEAADFVSPMTRGEAIRAVVSVLPIPASARMGNQGVLPKDLDPSDPLVSDFLTLQNLGILPESFQPILGQSQGLTAEETSLMLARAALRAGRVSLTPEVANVKGLKKAPPTPTFLSVLPPLKPRSCLLKDSDRPSAVSFADVLPGDPLFDGLRELVSRSTKNSAKQTLWLISGARRPTEFGIVRGQTKASISEPVSILETIRDILVLACLPPDTALDVMSGKDKAGNRQGSGESRVARDRISGLPRDASFASRVLYRAQDHQKEFDLSLFTYVPELLRGKERSPGSGLSVIEASRLLSSGLLMIHVKEKSLSPLQAENTMEELSAAIRKDLIGKDVDWRDESSLKAVPFTKGMLLQFLTTVVSGKMSVSSVPTPSTFSLGEIWWERIR